jgi:tetratricopeptide (TPR) repeat protein
MTDLGITLLIIFLGIAALVVMALLLNWFFKFIFRGFRRILAAVGIGHADAEQNRAPDYADGRWYSSVSPDGERNHPLPGATGDESVRDVVGRLYQEGRTAEIESELGKFNYAELDEANREAWRFSWGVAAFRRDDREEAFRRFSEAYAEFPNSQSIAFSLGQEYEARGDTTQMLRLFRQCSFPEVSAEYLLTASRYCYLWKLLDEALEFLNPICAAYFQLRIADDHFLYVRGLPFFGRTWRHMLCYCAAKNDFSAIESHTAQARRELMDYDFDSLQILLRCTQKGDFGERIRALEAARKDSAAGHFGGYQKVQLASLKSVSTSDPVAAAAMFDSISLQSDDFGWLQDVLTIHKARIASQSGDRVEEEKWLGQFFARQPLLFEPDHAIAFGFWKYQETLKPRYQQSRRRRAPLT